MQKTINKIVSVLLTFAMAFSLSGMTSLTSLAAKDDSSDKEFELTIAECENGGIQLNSETNKFNEGDEVSLSLKADEGYIPESFTITETASGNEVVAQNSTDTEYNFSFPAAAITVSATFREKTVPEKELRLENEVASDLIIEDYIKDNINPKYISSIEICDLVNVFHVRNMLADGNLVEPTDTVDSIQNGVSNNDISEISKWYGQIETDVAVYDVNTESDYVVAHINTMDDVARVQDVVFALNDNDGHVLDNIIYDYDTGIAYIPRDLFIDEDNNYLVLGLQAQMLQVIGGDLTDIESEVDSVVIDDDSADIYSTVENIFSMQTEVQTEAGLNEDEMSVVVNGIPVTEEAYDYNADTGIVSLSASSASIESVSVFTGGIDADEDVDASIEIEGDIQTYNATQSGLMGSWGSAKRVAEDVQLPSWVTAGTALYGDIYTSEHSYYNEAATDANTGYSFNFSGSYPTNMDYELMARMIMGTSSSYGVTISSNAPNSLVAQYDALYLMIDWTDNELVYTANVANNTYKGSINPEGQSIPALADIQNLYLRCGHITSESGLVDEEGGVHGPYKVPAYARFMYIDWDSGFAVLGVLTSEFNSQNGTTFFVIGIAPSTGYATMTKSSANTSITDGNNCYDLAGAQYTLYEDSECTTIAKDANENNAVLTTNSDGSANTLEMEQGTYYVKETKAPKGYYADTEVYQIEITADNTEDNPATVSVKDEPGSDPLRINIEKIDSATGKSLAQGGASLEGAEFTVKYYDGYYDSVSDLPEDATRTWVLKTTKDTNSITGETTYRALLDSDHFVSGNDFYYEGSEPTIPLGTITIEETKAPEGYKIGDLTSSKTGDTSSIFISKVELDTDIGKVVAGNEYEGADEIMRGNLSFEKQDGDTQERMANVEFKITSETTGESHYIWTDPNGQYDSTAVAHSQNTDAGESYQDGTWFYGTADESEGAPVDDSLGAFPYDTYLIEEMPCDANEGMELVTVEMTVYSDGYMVHLGTIDNYAKQVDLGTTLVNGWEGEHDEHEATVFENANITLIDTVHYTGLTEGKTYTMKGVLMDKSTGEVVLDDDGNEVRAEKTFTAEAEEGDVEIEFSFPASTLSYTDVVAFEYLYAEGEDEPIGSHEDLNDVNQSVHLRRPTVWTEATEVGTGNKYVEATDDVNIVDMLDITDLLVGHTYYLYGKAVDKDTGEIIIDENGDPIELTVEFVAESEEALLDVMNFHIDALGMEGKSIVFEEYVYADADRTILICEEEDLGSAEQTITFLSPIDLETTLIDAETESHSSVQDDHVVLVDTVEYEGAIVGETYTMTGTLMDKATGEAVYNLDGSDVTATTEFVAEEESGEVKMTFEFDATGLEDGDATVAYEQMFNSEGTLVGSHEDIDDEDQTVHFPEIHTNATDSETGTNVTEADDEAIIVDTVTYEGLTPGQEYTVEGTLMNKANGEAVVNADGEPVTGSTTFTPEEADGTVEVTFTLDASDLGGSTLVVFEDLLVNEVVVASHADLSDEDQTIYVPDIQTTATDAYDGDHEVEADGTVTIIDTVDYENLIPGQEYTMHGELMDENTGDSLGISNEVTFTPEEANGSVEIEFTFDASDMAGYTTVVFEKLYMTTENGDQVEVAKHEDLTDEGQTVYLAAPPTTSTPSDSGTPTETYSSPSETPEKVQTGDNDIMYLLALMATVCMACGLGLCYRRREDN